MRSTGSSPSQASHRGWHARASRRFPRARAYRPRNIIAVAGIRLSSGENLKPIIDAEDALVRQLSDADGQLS
jgi:hypothetical protein